MFSYVLGDSMQTEREEQESVARTLRGDTLWVRFVFVDHAGIPKTKAVHRDAFARRARAGVGLAKGVLALDPSGALHPASGLRPVGEVRLVPDLSSLTPLPFVRGQAMVCCDMTEPDARTPWDGCPRGALRRVLARFATRGYRSVASYEVEFYVRGPEGPLDRTPYAGSFALTAAAEFIAELAETLEEMGIRPEQCHAEVGQGNLELSVAETDALAAADRRVLVLEAIRGVAYRMGLQTTMAPKPYLEEAGNGHHLHLALRPETRPRCSSTLGALSDPGWDSSPGFWSPARRHGFHRPEPNSYRVSVPPVVLRIRLLWTRQSRGRRANLLPRSWSRGATANVELKPVDVTANPYRPWRGPGRRMDGMESALDPEPTMVDLPP